MCRFILYSYGRSILHSFHLYYFSCYHFIREKEEEEEEEEEEEKVKEKECEHRREGRREGGRGGVEG